MSVTLGAAGAHHRERFVARRVEEDDAAAVDLDRVRADVLRDAAGFALGDLRLADRVEQRRLAVVDVAHDRDDRRARREVLGLGGLGLDFGRALLRSCGSGLRRRNRARSVCAVSASSVELIVIIMRRSISFLSTSLTLTSSLSARSLTVMPSASVMSLVIGGGASCGDMPTGRSSRRGPVRGRGPDGPGRHRPRRHAGRRAGRAGRRRTNRLRGQRTRAAERRARGRRHRTRAGRRTHARAAAAPAASARAATDCGRMTGRCGNGRAAGASPVSGSSMRSRRVGGTRRPAGRAIGATGGGGRRGRRRHVPRLRCGRRGLDVRGRVRRRVHGLVRHMRRRRRVSCAGAGSWAGGSSSTATAASCVSCASSGSGSATGAACGGRLSVGLASASTSAAAGLIVLIEARPQRRRRRLGRLGAPCRRLLGDRRVGEQRAGRQRDVALARVALDELPRDDLLDRARRALHVDARLLLEQGHRVLARQAQQLGDFVNADSGQTRSL